jgi:hypothetical protein
MSKDDNIVKLVDLADSLVNPNNEPWTFDLAIEVVKLLAKAATEAYSVSFDILLNAICQKGFKIESVVEDAKKQDIVEIAGDLAVELQKDIEARR